ncbi:DUF6387 family protein [Pseudoalteromonas spongiae]|uniref:DUF6387 family protein n=1 Tax=Pseudoalteromonas spongiae TaxID=298657 RepID=UPI00110ACB43|nr:DUF6387 family protein [Pseudoalteromonas spongiae]TMO82445.1 hypothetical protein CWC15_19575 [Pseudoalteromonas spongiae]
MPTKNYLTKLQQLPKWYNLKNYERINELTLECLINNLEVRVSALNDIVEYSLSLDGDLKDASPFWKNVIDGAPFTASPFFKNHEDEYDSYFNPEFLISENELQQKLINKNLLQEDDKWGTRSSIPSTRSAQPLEYCDLINLEAIEIFGDMIGGNFNIAINSLLSSKLVDQKNNPNTLILEELNENFYLKLDLKNYSDKQILAELEALLPLWRKAIFPQSLISKKYNDFGSIKNKIKQILEWGLIPKFDLQIWLWDKNQQTLDSTSYIISHELFLEATIAKDITLDGYKKGIRKPESELINFSTLHKLKSFRDSNPDLVNKKLAELFF